MATVRTVDILFRAQTKQFQGGLKTMGQALQKATQGMTAAMGAISAGTAAAEKDWLQLGATVAMGFAAGPIVGFATAAGAAIGLLTAERNQAAAAAKKHEDATRKEIDALVGLRDEARASLEASLDLGRGASADEKAMRQMLSDRGLLEAQMRQAKVRFMEAGFALDEDTAKRGGIAELGISDPLTRAKQARREAVKALEAEIADLDRKIGLKNEEMEAERALATLERDRAAQEQFNLDGLAISAAGIKSVVEGWGSDLFGTASDALASFGAELEGFMLDPFGVKGTQEAGGASAPTVADAMPEPAEAEIVWDAYGSRASGVLMGHLSDGIADGIFDGFDNAADIVDSFARSMTATLIDAIADAAIGQGVRNFFQSVFSGIAGAAGGPTQSGGTGGAYSGARPGGGSYSSGGLSIAAMVAVPGTTINAGIRTSGDLQRDINSIGGGIRTLSQYRERRR